MNDMFERLKETISEIVEVNEDEITGDTRFVDDLGFNSFELMTFLGLIEEKFGIRIDPNEILGMLSDEENGMNTINDAVKLLEAKQVGK